MLRHVVRCVDFKYIFLLSLTLSVAFFAGRCRAFEHRRGTRENRANTAAGGAGHRIVGPTQTKCIECSMPGRGWLQVISGVPPHPRLWAERSHYERVTGDDWLLIFPTKGLRRRYLSGKDLGGSFWFGAVCGVVLPELSQFSLWRSGRK